jgi:type III secretion protein HrpB1
MPVSQCSNRLIAALIEVLMFGAKHGHLEQSERVLTALHILRPNFVELHAYDAWMLIRRHDFAGALRYLRDLEQRPLRGAFGPYVSALLAVARYGLQVPSWRSYANDVINRNEDQDSVDIVNALLGKASTRRAAAGAEAPVDLAELQKMMQQRHLRA